VFIPIITIVVGTQVSTQIFAASMNHDPRIVGNALYTIFGKKFYNPFLYLLCYIKFAFQDEFVPYLNAAIQPFFVGLISAVLLLLVLSICREIVKKNDNVHGTARWGTEKDLKKNGLTKKDGVILGQCQKANVTAKKSGKSLVLKQKTEAPLICHAGHYNALLLAPTGSGKGVSGIIPTLLSYR
jgi:type IV secretion system protein VirD4